MKNYKNNTYENTRGGKHVLTFIVIMTLLSALVPACTHDPFSPIDPNPVDTTENPIDTIDHPIDTLGEDTTVITCDTNFVYFETQILPILVSNCAKSGCHDAITHEKGLILNSYQNLKNGNIVKAYNLNGSKLYKFITDNDPSDVMPPPPNQKLTAGQITLISKWILQGAKDTTCVETVITCNTTAVSYSTFIKPLLTTYCVGCHSGGAPSGAITLNTYTGVQGVALNGRLIGAVSWANGYTKMPQGGAQLSECRIDKIQAWINDGAPNN